MSNIYTCATCGEEGTVSYVGFYEVGSETVCEFCHTSARKMDDDE